MPIKSKSSAIRAILSATIALGFASALGDWLWAQFIDSHRTAWGVLHGALLCMLIGILLSIFRIGDWGAVWRAAFIQLGIGVLAAGSFYAAYPLLGYTGGLVISWILLWLMTAWVLQRLEGRRASTGNATIRGLLAAIGSGMAFWSISHIWTDPPAQPNYGLFLLYWSWAFLPGVAALLWPTSKKLES